VSCGKLIREARKLIAVLQGFEPAGGNIGFAIISTVGDENIADDTE
jgi:hypothetical protein